MEKITISGREYEVQTDEEYLKEVKNNPQEVSSDNFISNVKKAFNNTQ